MMKFQTQVILDLQCKLKHSVLPFIFVKSDVIFDPLIPIDRAASLTTLFCTLFAISSFLSLYLFTHWRANQSKLTDQCTVILFFLALFSSSFLMSVLRR